MGDKDEWIEWDHALATALQVIEDYTDEYGLLAWELADEAVEVDAHKRIHKFKASVDARTRGTEKNPYKPLPGEYFVPDVWTRRKDEDGKQIFQTYGEWMQKEAEKQAVLVE